MVAAVAGVALIDGDHDASLAQSEAGAAAGAGSEPGAAGDSTGSGGVHHLDPRAVPTSHDPKRWESPASRLSPLKPDRPDEGDADVETAHEEAAALRREAAELRASLERLQAQEKRGARVKSEQTDAMRRRAEDLEDQIGDLQRRAGDLDEEAADLQGRDDNRAHDDVHHSDMKEDAVAPEPDPLSGDLDDPLDDDEGDLD